MKIYMGVYFLILCSLLFNSCTSRFQDDEYRELVYVLDGDSMVELDLEKQEIEGDILTIRSAVLKDKNEVTQNSLYYSLKNKKDDEIAAIKITDNKVEGIKTISISGAINKIPNLDEFIPATSSINVLLEKQIAYLNVNGTKKYIQSIK